MNNINFKELTVKTSAEFVEEIKTVLGYRHESKIKAVKEFEPIIFMKDRDCSLMVVIRTYGSIYEFTYSKGSSTFYKNAIATWYLEELGFKAI